MRGILCRLTLSVLQIGSLSALLSCHSKLLLKTETVPHSVQDRTSPNHIEISGLQGDIASGKGTIALKGASENSRYNVKIATDAACQNTVFALDEVQGSSISIDVALASGNYYLCIIESSDPNSANAPMTSLPFTVPDSNLSQVATVSPAPSPTQTPTPVVISPPPDAIIDSANADSSMSITLSWSSGGGSTEGYRIAYAVGTTAPSNCHSGTQITASAIGMATSYSVRGLNASTQYSFRICAVDGNTPVNESKGVTTSQTTLAPAITCDSGSLSGTCTISSAKIIAADTVIAGSGDLVIALGGSLLTAPSTVKFAIDMIGDVTIDLGGAITGNLTSLSATNLTVDGAIYVDGLGDAGSGTTAPGSGVGGGSSANVCLGGGGAGYGGDGGLGDPFGGTGFSGGPTFGSITAPVDFGSGGGHGCGGVGGNGGGVVKIVVTNTLDVDGTISANGTAGTGSPYGSGGGSGGSIWLEADTFSGATGTIRANGGGATGGGGGAGGRLAIFYDSKTFAGTLQAFGGTGYVVGGAGTIYEKAAGSSAGTLVFDNNATSGGQSAFSLAGSTNYDSITIKGAAIVHTKDSQSTMTIANLDVQLGSSISQDGLGSAGGVGGGPVVNGSGPGGGVTPGFCGAGSGGAYAGIGGMGASGAATNGNTYGSGSETEPTMAGSGGGGGGCSANEPGGAGGGTLKLTVGTLTVDGAITADGTQGKGGAYSGGGGSGGSIWLILDTLAGTGIISADGGDAENRGGGGGGGRIAITCNTCGGGATVTAVGGTTINGGGNGGAGTYYLNGVAQ